MPVGYFSNRLSRTCSNKVLVVVLRLVFIIFKLTSVLSLLFQDFRSWIVRLTE
jgi:hypothetical protein